MILIVVVEDNKEVRNLEIEWIKRALNNKMWKYKIKEYSDYTEELKDLIKTEGFKIYILDIELPSSTGLNIARNIREYDDISEIIICSSHGELELRSFKSKLKILDFVSKYDNAEQNLIDLIINIFEKQSRNILKIVDRSAIVFIIMNDILYIRKEKGTRNCIIKTFDNIFIVNKKLEEIKKILNNNFIQSSKSCIINQKNVLEYNFRDSKVVFKNKEEIDELSKSYIDRIEI